MPPPVINAADVTDLVSRLWWPSLRIGGFIAVAPIANEAVIPGRVKIVLAVLLSLAMSPLAPVPAGLSIFTSAGLFTAAQEILIGVAIGMVMQLAFEALTFAGQAISTTMGLGFATLIDPQHNASVPVLGQLFTIMGILTYLSINGHLVLLGALAHSFQSLPIGVQAADRGLLLAVASWGARIFETGLLVALPTIVALVIVNMALGVVMRAAPQLNLFGIGFTITLLGGFVVLMSGLDGIMTGITGLIDGALRAAADLTATPAAH